MIWESSGRVLVGGDVDANSTQIAKIRRFGPLLDLNYSILDLFEVFRSQVSLY